MSSASMIHLHVIWSNDPELDCIVCRRRKVDREIVYGINGGRAAQGIHARCIGRAQSIRPSRGIRRRRRDKISEWAKRLAADVADRND